MSVCVVWLKDFGMRHAMPAKMNICITVLFVGMVHLAQECLGYAKEYHEHI